MHLEPEEDAVQGLRCSVVGRDAELDAVQRLVSDLHGGPRSLVLEGAAGIGKTAIWLRGVEHGRQCEVSVRTSRCSEADAGWAFAGVGDLLEGLPLPALDELPLVQRSALSAALLISHDADPATGDRVLGVAVLGVLRALARTGPLVLAVDDVQWLDSSSRKVLSFALRRLTDEPVRLLTSCRSGPDPHGVAEADLGLPGQRVVVGPVSIGSLQRIVQARLGQSLARPTLTRLHQATGGNPMRCLEMAWALQRLGREPAADEPLPVPADLRALVTARLDGLSDGARELLLLTAALALPTIAAVTLAAGDTQLAQISLEEAREAGLLEVDGERVRVTHPLLGSIPYADLSPGRRRALHARLAAAVSDPEEHARHAALSTTERSAEVAAALEVAAQRAHARGSLDAAAVVAELAMSRTPVQDSAGLLRRTVDAARFRFLLGDVPLARATLCQGLSAAAPGPLRVPGLLLQATIASWEQGDATVAQWCDTAMAEAGDDPLLRARCHATLADTSPSGAVMDLFHAQSAVDLLAAMDVPPADLLAASLTNVACNRCRLGQGLSVEMLERAEILQGQGRPVPVGERAGIGLGMYLKVVDRFEESRTWLHTMRRTAIEEGDDSVLPITLGHLATLECWAGHYELAVELAVEGREHAARMGVRAPMPQSAHVLALAHQGHLDRARALAGQDLAADEALGYSAAVALHLRSLGFTELMSGDHPAAATHLLRSLSISSEEIGIAEPAILRLHADAVAALVALDRTDEAQRLTAELHASASSTGLPWATAMTHRCEGLLLAHDGDLAGATSALREAVKAHEALPMPFELARTWLLLGGVLRRSGHRNDARAVLDAALDVFVELGTPIQVDQARAELARLGGWKPRTSVLTPVEERIAGLVAAGQTNREVASALFLGVRTVESHLGRIYRKLQIRSRTELAHLFRT